MNRLDSLRWLPVLALALAATPVLAEEEGPPPGTPPAITEDVAVFGTQKPIPNLAYKYDLVRRWDAGRHLVRFLLRVTGTYGATDGRTLVVIVRGRAYEPKLHDGAFKFSVPITSDRTFFHFVASLEGQPDLVEKVAVALSRKEYELAEGSEISTNNSVLDAEFALTPSFSTVSADDLLNDTNASFKSLYDVTLGVVGDLFPSWAVHPRFSADVKFLGYGRVQGKALVDANLVLPSLGLGAHAHPFSRTPLQVGLNANLGRAFLFTANTVNELTLSPITLLWIEGDITYAFPFAQRSSLDVGLGGGAKITQIGAEVPVDSGVRGSAFAEYRFVGGSNFLSIQSLGIGPRFTYEQLSNGFIRQRTTRYSLQFKAIW